ncbi:spore coat protein CotJB [Oscillospiraceae bacterium MB08-C2-2]|nr:spore coat protein CotJB [Oscillospiraceae bacterium MB08-C2-2]
MSERQALLKRIQVLAFCLHDAALFLDVNPTNAEALEYYRKHNDLYEVAMDEFTTKYGPLSPGNYDGGPRWKWIDGPWPWEMEGN